MCVFPQHPTETMRNFVPEAPKQVNAISIPDLQVEADVFSSRHIYIGIARNLNTKRMTSNERYQIDTRK